MRPQIIWTIFCKEIKEALRDRLTLIVVLALPIFVYPLAVTSLSRIAKSQEATEEGRPSRIIVWGQRLDPMTEFLRQTNTLILDVENRLPSNFDAVVASQKREPPSATDVVEEDNTSSGAPMDSPARQKEQLHQFVRGVLVAKKADAALVVWPGTEEALNKMDRGRVTVYYDSIRPGSLKALDRLERELARYRRQVVEQRQEQLRLPKGFSAPLEIRSASVATARNEFGDRFGRLLPLLLIMLSATGALYAAVDLTAGEKDRATMQTLLCAPVMPLEIVAGKFLTVWTISLVSALANITSLGFTFTRVAASAHMPAIPIWVFAGILGMLALVTCTVAATFIGVAALARDAKDAGNFLSAALIMVTLPVAASIMPGVELNAWTAFVPLVNISLLIKAVFLEGLTMNIFFFTLVASLSYATLALVFAAHVFGREEILLGGSVTWRQLAGGKRRRINQPSPGLVLALFVVILVVAFYGSLLIEKRGTVISLLTTQYGFFLLPTALLALVKRYPAIPTFSLRTPSIRSVLGAILIGISGAAAVSGITKPLLPTPDSLTEGLKNVLMFEGNPNLWLALLLFAVTPALCEETLFRGMTMAGLRQLGPASAITVSALMFGVAHASIYRLLPTFLLGLALGYAAWRSGSIFCSMIVHVLNNGVIIVLLYKGESWLHDLEGSSKIMTIVSLVAFVVMAIGIALIAPRKGTTGEEPPRAST